MHHAVAHKETHTSFLEPGKAFIRFALMETIFKSAGISSWEKLSKRSKDGALFPEGQRHSGRGIAGLFDGVEGRSIINWLSR